MLMSLRSTQPTRRPHWGSWNSTSTQSPRSDRTFSVVWGAATRSGVVASGRMKMGALDTTVAVVPGPSARCKAWASGCCGAVTAGETVKAAVRRNVTPMRHLCGTRDGTYSPRQTQDSFAQSHHNCAETACTVCLLTIVRQQRDSL